MTQKLPSTEGLIEQAHELVCALENGEGTRATLIIEEISKIHESLLFQEVCKLTRQLHDTLANFCMDEKIANLTQNEIPDAKDRLNYVIAMTEQAANTTLNAVEYLLPVSEKLIEESKQLGAEWNRFRQRQMSLDEFKVLSQNLVEHFETSATQLQEIQDRLTEVLMAQGFQDLTGQIIRRVIKLVQEVEISMVEMIRISGRRPSSSTVDAQPEEKSTLTGPAVPGLDSGTVQNQDDVDSLLSSLGF
jgi:chemotaxis protein CheZ